MWHSFITCSEALKINISYLNLEPDNIWIYSIQNELPQSLSLCCILKCGGFWFCFLPSFPLISFLFGSPISNVIMFVRLEDDFFGFYFLTNLFFLEFGNFIHVHFQSFCHFEISKKNCLFTVGVFGANVTGKILKFERLFTFLLSIT